MIHNFDPGHVYMCIYIYNYKYIYMYIYICVSLFLSLYIYIYIYTCVCTCVGRHVYVYIHTERTEGPQKSIQAPAFGARKTAILQDLALATGRNLVSSQNRTGRSRVW